MPIEPAADPARPHAFAAYLRAVARGPTLGRPLDEAEAEAAMGMILDGAVEPVQLGALLLVLRYRTEAPSELAGFVRAVRARLRRPEAAAVDLDWPSYADRHKQLPYFLLAALLLAQNGVRVLMHGIPGEGPATTPVCLAALGIEPATDVEDAARKLDQGGFAYLPLTILSPRLAELFALRPFLGLRTPVHTAARELNPFGAPCQIQGVFHPTYLELHQATQRLLGQKRAVTFKGGGGEGQRNPDKPCRTLTLVDGVPGEEVWPALAYGEPYPWRGEALEPRKLADLWSGAWAEPGPTAAVTGTVALCLRLLGRARTMEEAQTMAESLWRERRLLLAA
ncbi:glycosyl transferase family protein [Benzoatithermus flavus]|uniref:Glycosyl transferase family protein n=1 Tax=Benzoatithermus flavus TaxID=3108223 RepID=A0ABU8XXH9_9PROT